MTGTHRGRAGCLLRRLVAGLAGLTLLVTTAATGLYRYYQSKIAHVRLGVALLTTALPERAFFPCEGWSATSCCRIE